MALLVLLSNMCSLIGRMIFFGCIVVKDLVFLLTKGEHGHYFIGELLLLVLGSWTVKHVASVISVNVFQCEQMFWKLNRPCPGYVVL